MSPPSTFAATSIGAKGPRLFSRFFAGQDLRLYNRPS
jgi:hypothetical protein